MYLLPTTVLPHWAALGDLSGGSDQYTMPYTTGTQITVTIWQLWQCNSFWSPRMTGNFFLLFIVEKIHSSPVGCTVLIMWLSLIHYVMLPELMHVPIYTCIIPEQMYKCNTAYQGSNNKGMLYILLIFMLVCSCFWVAHITITLTLGLADTSFRNDTISNWKILYFRVEQLKSFLQLQALEVWPPSGQIPLLVSCSAR